MGKNKLSNLLLVTVAILLVAIFALSVRHAPSPDKVALFRTEGITCGKCAAVLIGTLEAERGVVSATVDESVGRVGVAYDSRIVSPETLEARISSQGFGCRGVQVQTIDQYRASGAQLPIRHSKPCCCARDNKSPHQEEK